MKNNKINESLPRKHNMDQMNKLQRTINASGGDIESKVRNSSKSKESKMPNTMYMDNPLTSNRKISTYETFSKTDNKVKTTAAKSTQPKGMRKFENFNIELSEKLKFSDGEEFETSGELRKEERKDGWYVLGQGMLIPVKDEDEADKYIEKFGDKKTNEGRIPYREEDESRIESSALDDLKSNFRSYEENDNTEEDAEELLGIISERHPDEDEDNLRDMVYSWCGVKTEDEKNYDRDYKYHGRSQKYESLSESDKSDDKNYVEYKGKIGDRYADLDGNEFVVRGKVKGGVTIKGQGGEKEIDTNSLLKMKKLNESKKSEEKHIATKIDSWIQDLDTDVRGTMEDKLRPMFVNRPNQEIRPSYDILRAGKTIHIDGQDCSIIGLKNGKLLVDFINKEHKHNVIELSMKDALKYMKKSKKDKEE